MKSLLWLTGFLLATFHDASLPLLLMFDTWCLLLLYCLSSHSLSLFPPQVYPGLMATAGLIHYVLNLLHITVHIRDVCVFLAPVFSGLTAISTFLLTRELWNQGAGLLAACFIAIVPGYISRSVAGSFDNEGIAIFALQFTYYLWVCTVFFICTLYLNVQWRRAVQL